MKNLQASTRWVALLGSTLAIAACAKPDVGQVSSNVEADLPPENADDLELLGPPAIPLTATGAVYRNLDKGSPHVGELEVRVAAGIPFAEPNFVLVPDGWSIIVEPLERVITADGRVVASSDSENRVPLRLDAHEVSFADGTETMPDGSRVQHIFVTTRFCKPLRQSGDPWRLVRKRSDCTNAPPGHFVPPGESTPVSVHFDNGYRDERRVEPSSSVALSLSHGAGPEDQSVRFYIPGGSAFFVEATGKKVVNRLFIPLSHNAFPGYRGDGVERMVVYIEDAADARKSCLLMAGTPHRPPPVALPIDATEWIALGFRDPKTVMPDKSILRPMSEEECLPCNSPRTISVWHEFLNVPGSAAQTKTISFTRTTGRGCAASK